VFDERLKEQPSVAAADESFDAPLGVRHETEHVALRVHDAGDVTRRTVRVGVGRDAPLGVAVAEDNLIAGFELIEHVIVGVVAALAVRDGKLDDLPRLHRLRERRVRLLHTQRRRLADEAERLVAHERAGQQSALAEDLKSIADADYEPPFFGKADHVLHDGREARDGSRTQIVAVGEPAWNDDNVDVAQCPFFVPDKARVLVEDVLRGVIGVVVAVRPGEDDDSKRHGHGQINR